MNIVRLIILLSGLSLGITNAFAEQQAFTKLSFEQVKQQHQGQQWLMILWSVDCPACFKELALLEKIRQKKKDLAVVLINVDDYPEVLLERIKILTQYRLTDVQSLFFIEGQADQNRFLIDAHWYGELPRSYFVDSKGVFHGKSGLLNEQQMTSFLLNSQ